MDPVAHGPDALPAGSAVHAATRTPLDAGARLSRTHEGRCAAGLAGYGFFLRDLRHKTHSRVMDLLADRLLRHRAPPRGHPGPGEHYGPAAPTRPWDAPRHTAWATPALASALDVTL